MSTATESHDYIAWYRLAQEVLGTLIPALTDEEIRAVSPRRANWFAVPLASESSANEVANRHDPHVDFKLTDDGRRIRIGIRCNTVASVEKLENILNSFHGNEKADLVSEMQKLDGDFQTRVMAKIKETNFAHVDGYETKFEIASNSINDNVIEEIFEATRRIRNAGIVRKKDESLSLNPETPVLDLCYVTVSAEPSIFKEKLNQMKRIYEICLCVRTSSELREESRKRKVDEEDFETKYVCAKCAKEFPVGSARGMRFCDEDGMRIVAVKVPRSL